jgi:hypothetical protein
MDVLDQKSNEELLKSLLAEVAKAQNEIRCSQQDLSKAQSRISFLLVVINTLIKRQEINR